MKLSSKGRFADPPRLPKYAQSVSEGLAGWPDVHARTQWLLGDEREVDGADFYVGEDEIGHIHLGGEAHVAVGRNLGAALVAADRAKPFRWSDEFVVLSIRSPRDAQAAMGLFRMAYERRRGTLERELVAPVAEGAAACIDGGGQRD
jgi:Family of unknown function (DUF5519)